jgi:hypothetical protein
MTEQARALRVTIERRTWKRGPGSRAASDVAWCASASATEEDALLKQMRSVNDAAMPESEREAQLVALAAQMGVELVFVDGKEDV